MAADGWSEWGGRLKTSPYREYKSHGLGVNGGHRIVDYPLLTAREGAGLTAAALLVSRSAWDPVAEAQRRRQLAAK